MTQLVEHWRRGERVTCVLPDPEVDVLTGVPWGRPEEIFTPAFWKARAFYNDVHALPYSPFHRPGGTLAESLAFCLLGGHGVTAELAGAAFNRCVERELLSRLEPSVQAWEAALSESLETNGRRVHYRFPKLKARYLGEAMRALQEQPPTINTGTGLRDYLQRLSGIGPKTAAWIVRNYMDADDVAILDIHVVRAGRLCGLYSPNQSVSTNYSLMETRFIEFCEAVTERVSTMDALIWHEMRQLSAFAIRVLRTKGYPTDATASTQARRQQSKRARPSQLQLQLRR